MEIYIWSHINKDNEITYMDVTYMDVTRLNCSCLSQLLPYSI